MLAAEVGKPHGLAGEVYVVPISDDPRRFEPGSTLKRADGSSVVIESARRHTNRFLVKFEGIDTREGAERLRGPLYVPAADVRALEDDEFWPHEIEGATAVTPSGETLGTVSRIVPGPAQDLLELHTDRGERLVPLVKEIVTEVDVERGRVTIDAPPGLLE